MGTTQSSTGISATQRASIVDHMILQAVHPQLSVCNDAVFTAVACLDRYLAVMPTPLYLLQPLGIACLWVAAKYKQRVVPPAARFAQLLLGRNGKPLGGDSFARELLVMLEEYILKALDYRLANIVTTIDFKHQILQQLHTHISNGPFSKSNGSSHGSRGIGADGSLSSDSNDTVNREFVNGQVQQQWPAQQLYYITSYLSEISLLEYKLLPWLPSQLASAAFAYAHVLLGLPLYPNSLEQVSGHTLVEVQEPMVYLCALHSTLSAALQVGKPYAVTIKYCDAWMGRVATVLPINSIEDARLADW